MLFRVTNSFLSEKKLVNNIALFIDIYYYKQCGLLETALWPRAEVSAVSRFSAHQELEIRSFSVWTIFTNSVTFRKAVENYIA